MRFVSKAFVLLLAATSCFAQSVGGLAGISGTVTDPSGSVVANAKVVVSNEARGITRSLATNGDGLFSAPGLIPGPGYKVDVNAAGFAPYPAADIDLEVGQNLNLAIALAVGSTTTSVEVSGAAEL